MSFFISENAGSKKELLEADNYVARCYGLIMTGTKFDQRFGKAQTKVVVLWELPTATITIEKDGETKVLPKAQSATYTWSFNEKSNLRKTLEAWRGKAFSAEELKGFDVRKVVGTPCLLNIIQAEREGGIKYNKITSVSKLPNGFECPKQVNPSVIFDITDENEDLDRMSLLPQWVQDRIRESDEYQKRLYGNEEEIPEDYEF